MEPSPQREGREGRGGGRSEGGGRPRRGGARGECVSGGGSRGCPRVGPGGRSGLALGGGATSCGPGASSGARSGPATLRVRPPAPPAWHVPRCRVLALPRASACVAAAAWLSPLLRLSVSRTCPDSFGLLVPVRASNLLTLEGVVHVVDFPGHSVFGEAVEDVQEGGGGVRGAAPAGRGARASGVLGPGGGRGNT